MMEFSFRFLSYHEVSGPVVVLKSEYGSLDLLCRVISKFVLLSQCKISFQDAVIYEPPSRSVKVYTGIHYVWVSQHSVFNAQEQPHGRSDFMYFVGLMGCVIVSIGCFHFHFHLTVSLIQLHMDTVAESQGCVGK